jgi:hypothetical protein
MAICDMTEATESEDGGVRYVYPKKSWVLPLVCHLWILALFCLVYYKRIPGTLSPAYAGTLIGYLVLVSLWLGDLPSRLSKVFRPIILHEHGIDANGRFVTWDKIEKISHGPGPFRRTYVYLKLKTQSKGFFDFSGAFSPKRLTLLGFPFVYRDVIPIAVANCPDVSVSHVVRESMTDPEHYLRSGNWAVFICLVTNMVLLSLVLVFKYQTMLYYFIIGGLFVTLSGIFASVAVLLARTSKETFTEYALSCTVLVGVAINVYPFSIAEYLAIEVLVTAAMVSSVIAVAVLVGFERLSRQAQGVVVLLLVLIPAGVYAWGRSQLLIPTDITHLMPDGGTPFWGSSGKYLTVVSHEKDSYMVEMPALEKKVVPQHEGKCSVIWLDEQFLIRETCLQDRGHELWVYDLSEKVECKIPTSGQISIGRTQPVSANGHHLVWIDYEEDENADTLRFWNLETMRSDLPDRSLPAVIKTSWYF